MTSDRNPALARSILLTAYEPYDGWPSNASQLVLDELASGPDRSESMTARVYPVDFSTIRSIIAADLAADYDFAVHMGQAPGYREVTLEAIGVNLAVERGQRPDEGVPLVPGGAEAYRSQFPLAEWADGLRELGIPAVVSQDAGTYLCNAALYLSRHISEENGLRTKSVFLHLPMATEQLSDLRSDLPTLPLTTLTDAVRWILEQL
jgi:pyroglutamyl-peptidase